MCDVVLIFSGENRLKLSSNDLIVIKNRDNIIFKNCDGTIKNTKENLQKMVELIISKIQFLSKSSKEVIEEFLYTMYAFVNIVLEIQIRFVKK